MMDKLRLLKAITIYTFQQETAYWANTWAHVLSTFFYTLSMIFFIDVLYSNVNTIVGYTKNEMLLFVLVGQATYYISWIVYANISDMIDDVNNGNLDLVLVKPVSPLFFINFRRIRLFRVLMDSIPPLVLVILKINWGYFNFTATNLLVGIVIAGLGIISSLSFQFITSLPVFWIGESRNIVDLSSSLEYNVGKIIPLEGFNKEFKIFFSTALPFLISTAFSTSVILGKSNPYTMFLWSSVIATLMLFLRNFTWNKALKTYTSASS